MKIHYGNGKKLTNEMILEGGDEMVNSVTYIFREISLTQQIANQWKTMRIKSIHKKMLKTTKLQEKCTRFTDNRKGKDK